MKYALPLLLMAGLLLAGCTLSRSVTSVPPASPQPVGHTTVAPATEPPVVASPSPAPSPTPRSANRLLEVPIYRQQHALSCEAAALRMAMATLGRKVAEDDLLAKLARDPTPRRVLADGSVQWGDPDLGFVGQWDGVFLKDGYGVYDGPIAALALAHGFEGTSHGAATDPARLYEALRQGFPSIVWVPYGLEVKDQGVWRTPLGRRIDWVVTEHAVVLAGVDAEGIYYADPMKPSLQRATYHAFEAAFGELGRRAVILRP